MPKALPYKSCICRCICWRRHVFIQSLWHTMPELPRNHSGGEKMWEVEFFMPEAWSYHTCRCICLCRPMGAQSFWHNNRKFPQLFVSEQFREWLIVGSWVFYAKSVAIQQGYICRCICLRTRVFMQSLWHTKPELPRINLGSEKMWQVEFFMPKAVPYNMIASADVYACVDTYWREAFGINNLNFPPVFENFFGSEQHLGSWVFYAMSSARWHGSICRCILLCRQIFTQSLWHKRP